MVELFQTTKQNVNLHIQNIFDEGELTPEATVKDYLTVQTEGSRQVERRVAHYNLDVIIYDSIWVTVRQKPDITYEEIGGWELAWLGVGSSG